MDEDIKKKIQAISNSQLQDEEKLRLLNEFLGTLLPMDHPNEIIFLCDQGIDIGIRVNKFEVSAQLCLIKAKAKISEVAPMIHEMKNITLALSWFGFSLESTRKRYEELHKKVLNNWQSTQDSINQGFDYLRQNPYMGATAYCYQTCGEIYANYYLQLRLYYFISGRPWRARLASFKFIMFLNLDEFFVTSKESRKKMNNVKSDCLKSFAKAIEYYKKEKAWEFLANCYLSLALEHHSFSSPIRSKFFLYKAKYFIKKYKITTLQERFEGIRKMPLIGSDRDD
ncbi:MAG: hypothetical protein WC444_04000 [Candidatus Paceibacterota bacterium]